MNRIEPVLLSDLFLAVIAGALLIMCGALYAATLALARLNRRRDLAILAYLFFAGLAACVVVLARALHLSGFWELLVGLLLAGYLVAPHLIWKLSVATHADEGEADEAPANATVTHHKEYAP